VIEEQEFQIQSMYSREEKINKTNQNLKFENTNLVKEQERLIQQVKAALSEKERAYSERISKQDITEKDSRRII
jgi:predicted transcriptional regulator